MNGTCTVIHFCNGSATKVFRFIFIITTNQTLNTQNDHAPYYLTQIVSNFSPK